MHVYCLSLIGNEEVLLIECPQKGSVVHVYPAMFLLHFLISINYSNDIIAMDP